MCIYIMYMYNVYIMYVYIDYIMYIYNVYIYNVYKLYIYIWNPNQKGLAMPSKSHGDTANLW